LRNSNNLPIVNAMSTLISAVQVAVVYLMWWGIRRVSRRRGSGDELATMVTSGVRA
jgi:spermidine/putrescine transport system permease protein